MLQETTKKMKRCIKMIMTMIMMMMMQEEEEKEGK